MFACLVLINCCSMFACLMLNAWFSCLLDWCLITGVQCMLAWCLMPTVECLLAWSLMRPVQRLVAWCLLLDTGAPLWTCEMWSFRGLDKSIERNCTGKINKNNREKGQQKGRNNGTRTWGLRDQSCDWTKGQMQWWYLMSRVLNKAKVIVWWPPNVPLVKFRRILFRFLEMYH
jgi:hypothetical protein